MSIHLGFVEKEKRHIEVVATDIADLAMMGFGSVNNCMNVYNALSEKYTHVNFNMIRTRSDLEKIVFRKPDLVFTGIKYVVFGEEVITKKERTTENGTRLRKKYFGRTGTDEHRLVMKNHD